jgi:curli biogenesis system outer membrane secretion channel CsgG
MKKLILLPLLFSLSSVFGGDLPSIAVADFTSDQWRTTLTHGLPDIISDALVNSGRFDVYERDKLKTIMREQSLQASGFTDPQTAVALGKVAGVHYILTGEIIDYGHESHTFNGYGVSTRSTTYRLTAAVKVIDVQTGRVLFSHRDDAQETVNEGQGMNVTDTTMDTKLAEEVSDKLITALENNNSFKAPDASASALVSVKITSEPDHADVEVDGVFYGNAGGEVKLPSGLHLVKISLPGYEDWSKKVLVQDGLSINAALVKQADARIQIQTQTSHKP